MKSIYKLILKSYLGPMFLTFFIVMFILLMNFMFRYIDELVGKGLETAVILELLFYGMSTMIPLGLPLATLLASIMTMGDLGENNELLAMKCAGMSLQKIIKPLVAVIICFSIASFFVANNLVPYSVRKMYALLYDIRQQRQTIEFQDGIFFNGIDNMSIRVSQQHPESGLLENVLIYDTRDRGGKMQTTVADSGYIRLSQDKNFLLVTLFNGENYEQGRGNEWREKSTLSHKIFSRQDMILEMEGFNMERTDESLFANSRTRSLRELNYGMDSLETQVDRAVNRQNNDMLANTLFIRNRELAIDTLEQHRTQSANLLDSIAGLDEQERARLVSRAAFSANTAKNNLAGYERNTKDLVAELYKYQTEWHKMLSLPVSVLIFFLIGAPLGAIIRKGGLGMPIVVSVIFFVIYYVVSLFGEKMAREGTWSAFAGTWLSSFILFPIAVFLTWKSTNDSSLFNVDRYYLFFQKVKALFTTLLGKQKAV
jgi:lipopolysaccharide export system permease protein